MIKIENKLKKIMTDLAAGHITQLEADELINGQQPDEKEKGVGSSADKKIKKSIKGGKTKSHKIT